MMKSLLVLVSVIAVALPTFASKREVEKIATALEEGLYEGVNPAGLCGVKVTLWTPPSYKEYAYSIRIWQGSAKDEELDRGEIYDISENSKIWQFHAIDEIVQVYSVGSSAHQHYSLVLSGLTSKSKSVSFVKGDGEVQTCTKLKVVEQP